MTPKRVFRPAAATLLVAAAGVVLPATPAVAATCSSDTGVSVVVDARGVGGSIATSCIPDGGGDTAAALFEVHHDLTRASQFPGAVCRVDGAPADAECRNMPPADAYWGLFWSDGSGGWVYSSEGVDSLNVPDGGSVAFAWQDGGDQDAPGVAPPQTQDEPSPSPTPSGGGSGGSGGGSGGSGSGGGGTGGNGGGAASAPSAPSSGSPTNTPTGSATTAGDRGERSGQGKRDRDEDDRKRGKKDGDGKKDRDEDEDEDETATEPPADASTTTDPVVTADPPDASDDGLPVWVAPAGIAVLFGIAGVVALLHRRSMA